MPIHTFVLLREKMSRIVKLLILTSFMGAYAIGVSAQGVHYADSTRYKSTSTVHTFNHHYNNYRKRPKPITKEMSVGFRFNTDGWSFYIDRGKVKSEDYRHADMFYSVRLWQLEVGEKKHPKEYKSTNSNLDPYAGVKPTPFIFGKINNFYTIKLGYGKRKMIAGKPDPGSIAIHWVYMGGLSLGLLKPYYIKVDNSVDPIKYTDATRDQFLSEQNIIGAAGFTKGWNEVKLIPGIHAKTALHFDFAASRKTVLAIETGLNAELYTQKIPLMVNQEAKPYFLDIFASFQFGKRW